MNWSKIEEKFNKAFPIKPNQPDTIWRTDALEFFHKIFLENQSEKPDPRFDNFWFVYPRKTAKKRARQIWNHIKMTDELFCKIIEKIEEYKKSPQWKKDNGQFIPHPATWLYQERWNDEVGLPVKSNQKYQGI